MVFSACFWWLSVLSNKKRPWALPLVRPSNMSIVLSVCLRRSSALKYPSQFLPALKIIWASLVDVKKLVKMSDDDDNQRGLTRPHHIANPNLMSGSPTPSMTGHCPWPLMSTFWMSGSIQCCVHCCGKKWTYCVWPKWGESAPLLQGLGTHWGMGVLFHHDPIDGIVIHIPSNISQNVLCIPPYLASHGH